MKKLISLVLVLVLVFALAVPSFAAGDNSTELDALNNIDYYVYWIFQDFTEKLDDSVEWLTSIWQILTNSIAFNVHNMADDLSSMYDNLFGDSTYIEPLAVTISNSLTGLEDSFNFFNDSFFDNVLWGESFAEVVQDNLTAMAADLEATYQLQQYLLSDRWDFFEGSWWVSMYEDIHQLKEVLASDEDVLIRDNQNNNFASAISTILSGDSSSSSIGGDDISSIVDFSSSFVSLFALPDVSDNVTSYLSVSSMFIELSFSDFNLLGWFTDDFRDSLVTVPMTYSRDNSNVVVTHYYQDNREFLNSLLGGDLLE